MFNGCLVTKSYSMNETCTHDLLIKFLYHETTPAENRLIHRELKEDYLLREEFSSLQKAFRRLPRVRFSASPKALNAVLQFSQQSALEGLI